MVIHLIDPRDGNQGDLRNVDFKLDIAMADRLRRFQQIFNFVGAASSN
jgi:hypothetical protein